MNKAFSNQIKIEFDCNRNAVTKSLKSIENSFFSRTQSYLDEITNDDGSVNNEKTHAFVKHLIAGLGDEINDTQREMYDKFLYCTFICMGRNLLPSFENVIALARNTEITQQQKPHLSEEMFAKDKFIPRLGLSGIVTRAVDSINQFNVPTEKYDDSDPSYFDFCKRYGYGTYCRSLRASTVVHDYDSDEVFARLRDDWDNNISKYIPHELEFITKETEFLTISHDHKELFKTSDIEKMIDIWLFTEGRSVLSTSSTRLSRLIDELILLDSKLLKEHDLLENAAEFFEGDLDAAMDKSLSVFDMLKEQDNWINKSTSYINDMLSGMNINYQELIVGSTPEETDKRIRRLIKMIEKSLTEKTWKITDTERETLRCFLYCAMWEGLAIRGNRSYANCKCETFGELLHRADLAVHFCRYSNSPLERDLLGKTTRAIVRSQADDTEVHFEHDDDSNTEFDSILFNKSEYVACSERLREILRKQEEANPEVIDPEYNMYLYNLQSLISTAIKAFLYCNRLTAFSFGNDFDSISNDIRQSINRIEKVSNRMRFNALQKTQRAINSPDSE